MEIPLSKTKLIVTLIACLIIIPFVINISLNPEQFISYRFRDPEFIRFAGIAIVVLCVSACSYFPINLFDEKTDLGINDLGINDNSSAVSVGLILWKDIISIRTEKVKSSRFLVISVHNPEKYIENAAPVKKMLLKANMKIYGTPLSINAAGSKYNFNELEKLVVTGFEKYKNAQPTDRI